MLFNSNLTTAEILDAFTEAVAARGGRVHDTFIDERRLFVRSILLETEEVRPGDAVQGGVALKATEESVSLYPYVYRLVCRNGAIRAETQDIRSIDDLQFQAPDTILASIREAVDACCERDVFMSSVRKMRTAAQLEADMALSMLPMLSQLRKLDARRLLSEAMRHFLRGSDQSQFGLANVITAIARDTRDPEQRWDLEELGGALAFAAPTPGPVDREAAGIELSEEEVEVV
jgi:hypothetical protein